MYELTFWDVVLRLLLSFATGGILGYGRSRKRRAAGLRTYILTSIGACMAILLACYENAMLTGQWADIVADVGFHLDASRYGAQVITGIGFLAAGTIIATSNQQVSGLTTATGLFGAACIGIAAGAGFIECVIAVMVPIIFVLDHSYPLEYNFKRRLRNMTIHVSFDNFEHLGDITELLDAHGVRIFEMDIQDTDASEEGFPSVIMSIRLSKAYPSHSNLLSSVAELPCVEEIQELIS